MLGSLSVIKPLFIITLLMLGVYFVGKWLVRSLNREVSQAYTSDEIKTIKVNKTLIILCVFLGEVLMLAWIFHVITQ